MLLVIDGNFGVVLTLYIYICFAFSLDESVNLDDLQFRKKFGYDSYVATNGKEMPTWLTIILFVLCQVADKGSF